MSIFTIVVRFLVVTGYVTLSQGMNFTEVITTEYGPIRGKITLLENGLSASSYLAFPFAQAQRFERPTGPIPWTAPLNATEHGYMCPQFLIPGLPPSMKPDEDCLTISVYAPASPNETSNLPVMHWIHGGGYMFGFSSLYDFSILAAERNVIVVASQYRVGAFAWLSTGTKDFSGNLGLFDMLEALKWTKRNIRSFGGNPDQVTLIGQSAGGIAVSTLMLSPLTEGLFDNVIIMSGYAYMILAVQKPEEALQTAREFGEQIGCTDMAKLKDCVKEKTMEEIVIAQSKVTPREFFALFCPVVDGEFLLDLPSNIIAEGKFRKANMIVGFTDDDGGTLLQNAPGLFKGLNTDDGVTREAFLNYTKRTFFVREQNPKIVAAIVQEYTDWSDLDNVNKTRRSVFDLATDVGFRVPALQASQAFAKKNMNAFVYQFDYKVPKMFDGQPRPDWMGAYHGADLFYLLGPSNYFTKIVSTFGNVSDQFGREFREFIANFATTGNPNPTNSNKWPMFTTEEQRVLLLHPNPAVKEKLVAKKVAFWNEFIPTLQSRTTPIAVDKQKNQDYSLVAIIVLTVVIGVLLIFILVIIITVKTYVYYKNDKEVTTLTVLTVLFAVLFVVLLFVLFVFCIKSRRSYTTSIPTVTCNQ